MAIVFDLKKDIRFKQGFGEGFHEGLCEGLQSSIEYGLHIRFGVKGNRLLKKVKIVNDVKKLENIIELIRCTDKLSEIEAFLKQNE